MKLVLENIFLLILKCQNQLSINLANFLKYTSSSFSKFVGCKLGKMNSVTNIF